MKKRFAICISVMLTIACLVRIYRDTYHIKLTESSFCSHKLPKGSKLSILQITDLHNHVFGPHNERLLNTVKKANVDVIVLTGDLIDQNTTSFAEVWSLIEQLTSINKHIFFVPGNHEWGNNRTSSFLAGLRAQCVTILDNRAVTFTKGSLTVNLAGVDDPATGHANLQQSFRELSDSYYTILLAHAPEIVTTSKYIPADLVLSGHTHGGQVRLPFLGALVAPGQGLHPTFDKGTYHIGSQQHLYIDSGVGTTRLPVRFLNQSQMSLVTISGEPAE